MLKTKKEIFKLLPFWQLEGFDHNNELKIHLRTMGCLIRLQKIEKIQERYGFSGHS